MLEVVTPAANLAMLTIDQMRAAAGLDFGDTCRDVQLTLLTARLSAEIADACNIAAANDGEPTLLRETVRERFRETYAAVITLARRHHVNITSVVVDGRVLPEDAYYVDGEAGLVYRSDGWAWRARTITVEYLAGFSVTPPVVSGVMMDLVRLRLSEVSRDPLIKSERVKIDGVEEIETQYWVSATGSTKSTGPLPPEYVARLSRFMNYSMR